MGRKKKNTRPSVSDDDRDWIIRKHAILLDKIHKDLVAEGFSFDAKKTRFWVRKDNGISVKFFYLKQKNSNSLEIQSILVRLSIKQHTLFVDYDNVETTFLIKI